MPEPRYVECPEAVNIGKRLYWNAIDGDGVITNFQDAWGDETDDPEDAVVAIVQIKRGGWLAVDLREFNHGAEPPLH